MAERAQVIGLLDAADVPGEDSARARASLSWCSSCLIWEDHDRETLVNALSAGGEHAWILLLRANEWLPDDAADLTKKLSALGRDVDSITLDSRSYIGHEAVHHPLLDREKSPRLVRASALRGVVSAPGLPIHFKVGGHAPAHLEGIHIHRRVAGDINELVAKVLPSRDHAPVPGGAAEALAQFYRNLEDSFSGASPSPLQASVGVMFAWSELQKEICAGTFDDDPRYLEALRLIPASSVVDDRESGIHDQERIQSLQQGLEHAIYHLREAEQRVKGLQAELSRVRHLARWLNSGPVGWVIRGYHKLIRTHAK